MLYSDLITRLEDAFTRDLPGAAAQEHLAPMPRRQWPAGFNPARIRHAAGLVLVFPKTIDLERPQHAEKPQALRAQRAPRSTSRDEAHILLTVRAHTLGRHGGQVSLPGGVIDPGETFEQAALREAHEEVGLARDRVRVLGALTPLDIPVSGFCLHPIVGVSGTRPRLTPAHEEVARILEVDLEDLLSPGSIAHTARERDGVAFTIPGFHVHGVEIWGATAMVLAEFLSLLGWTLHQDA